MQGYSPTNRTCTDHETGLKYRLYTSREASRYHLISEGNDQSIIANGSEITNFYLATNSDAEIKLNGSNRVKLKNGTFYNVKPGETITHRKLAGMKQFKTLPAWHPHTK